ncbi:MAG: hypothetical protein J6D27_09385 [Ruminiclostridium sp.]|nr:hypothetical protein [Ruminiclostridium sp.]
MALLKKCNFILLPVAIWTIIFLYNSFLTKPMSEFFLSISNPSWAGFVVHTLIQLTIICGLTVIAIKYFGFNVKRFVFSVLMMYLLFAAYSCPAIYLFVYTGGWSGFWQQHQQPMPFWEASMLITLQYGFVMLITTLIVSAISKKDKSADNNLSEQGENING